MEIFEIRNKRGVTVIVIIGILIIAMIWYFHYLNKQKKAISNFFEYEGDSYDGTYSYVGDKEDLTKGRPDAHSARTILFKVVEPANVLKHERNRDGEHTMIQTGRVYKKGTQFRVFFDSLQSPMTYHGKNFVQNIKGEYIRLDKISKV